MASKKSKSKTEKGFYSRERDARKKATDQGLKEGVDFEIVSGPKGFSIRMKKKYEPVEGAKLHGLGQPESDQGEPTQAMNVPTDMDHIFLDKSNDRYRWEDETGGLSSESYETKGQAKIALDAYVNNVLGVKKESPPQNTLFVVSETQTPEQAEQENNDELAAALAEEMNPPGEIKADCPVGHPWEDVPQASQEMINKVIAEAKNNPPPAPVATEQHNTLTGAPPPPLPAVEKPDLNRICFGCNKSVATWFDGENVQRYIDHEDERTPGQPCAGAEEPVKAVPVSIPVNQLPPGGAALVAANSDPINHNGGTTPSTRAHKSTVSGPSKRVWQIAEDMHKENPQVRRKDVIEKCVKSGIAFYTARTQYQQWLQATRESDRNAAEANAKKE